MRIGLTGRILIGGGLIAVFFAVQFVLSIQSFHGIRHDTREQQHAQQAVVAAIRFEKLVLDLETGTRGYVITADRQFLQPYEAARRALPSESATLMSLAPRSFSTELDRMWRSYLAEYAIPLINQAAHSRAAARVKVAGGEGKRRTDLMRGLIDPFVQRENAVADSQVAPADECGERGDRHEHAVPLHAEIADRERNGDQARSDRHGSGSRRGDGAERDAGGALPATSLVGGRVERLEAEDAPNRADA